MSNSSYRLRNVRTLIIWHRDRRHFLYNGEISMLFDVATEEEQLVLNAILDRLTDRTTSPTAPRP